jgi:hypothetical protein
MSSRIVLVVLVLVVAGCGREHRRADTAPAGLVGEISYSNGSVAPPYHFRWRVEFDARGARLEWTPGYGDTETWTETADLGADERSALRQRLRETGLFEFTGEDDGLVGGPTGRARFASDGYDSGTLGTSEAGSRMLDAVVAVTRTAFPDAVWTAMERRQDQWGDRQPR